MERVPRQEAGPIVITGGRGLLGRALVANLRINGMAVRSVDIAATEIDDGPQEGDVSADLRDMSAVEMALEGASVVVHTAGYHDVHLPATDPAVFFDNNVRTLYNVLQAAERGRVKGVVFTSTTGVYGTAADPDSAAAKWVTESTPRDWRHESVYQASKVAGEDLCDSFARRTGRPTCVLRCTRLCADHNDVEDNARKLSQGVDIRDAVHAHRLATDSILGSRLTGSALFNIGPPTRFTRGDLSELYTDPCAIIERRYPGGTKLLTDASIPISPITRIYDISRARSRLGYDPQFGFDAFMQNGG